MKVIGITGGVGSGKSTLLDEIKKRYPCIIINTDKIANMMKEPGGMCYNDIVSLLGKDILDGGGRIDNKKMAAQIFGNEELVKKVNGLIHPRVEDFVREKINEEKEKGETEYLFIESALLIEAGYKEKFLDELWYVTVSPSERRKRLKASRNYSDEKTDAILKSQLSDEEFKKESDFVIDNSGTLKETLKQLDSILQ